MYISLNLDKNPHTDMKKLISYFCFYFLLCTIFCCTTKDDKHPKDVKGQIVSFTKNGISRMDTIQKYFPNQEIEFIFGESTSGAMTNQVYPFSCGFLYYIDGITYHGPYKGDNCMNAHLTSQILNPHTISWSSFSYSKNVYISFVDGEDACGRLDWQFNRVGKKGDFDLEHTTAGGDVYKLEFR